MATQVKRLPDIAFIGKMGAGKTTAAELLEQGLGYRRLSFAAPLKKIAGMLWGRDALNDREKLQQFGVAVRNIQEDTWASMLLREYQGLRDTGAARDFVVDDCRFPNEYWALKQAGFVIVRITAPVEVRTIRLVANGKLQDRSQLEHVSETALDGFSADYEIANDSFYPERLAADLREIVNREEAKV